MPIRLARWWFAMLAAAAPCGVAALAADGFALNLIWSSPIAGAPPPPPPGTIYIPGLGSGLVLRAQATTADGRLVFLGNRVNGTALSPVLLADAEHSGPTDARAIELDGAPCRPGVFSSIFGNASYRPPYLSTLTMGPDNAIWIGGACNEFMDWSSSRHSDAYLTKLGADGKQLWEKTYSNDGLRNIRTAALLPSGDLIVAGVDGWDGWLARIASDGEQVWERHIGNDLGSEVAALPDGRIAVLSMDYTDAVVWVLDGAGKVLTQTRVRSGLGERHNDFFKLTLVANADALYVASAWAGLFHAQVVEITRLTPDGKLVWTAALPDTIEARNTQVTTWQTCAAALAVTPRGDAVVACALDDQIGLYRLEASSGAVRESRIALPECQGGHPAALFLAVKDEQTMILSGSRPTSNNAAGCSWVGRLTGASEIGQ